MNYEKIYYDLVLSAKLYPKKSDYYENHHIQPSSMGGSDNQSNMVKFTAKQHYIAHFLLWKHYKSIGDIKSKHKMARAFNMMRRDKTGKRYVSSTYEIAKKAFSEAHSLSQKGKYVSPETKKKLSIAGKGNQYAKGKKNRLGKKHSDETKMKIGLKSKGRKHSDETIKKIRDKLKNRIMSPQHIDNIKKANLKYPEKQLTTYDETHRSCKKVYQYDLDNNFIKEYPSGRAAGIETGCSINGISACCNNKQIQSGGFIWSFNYPL